jgi:hypothetical protein
MYGAMWVASVFGPYLVIVGLWMLLYSDNLLKVVNSVKNSPSCFYLWGTLNLLFGLTILNIYGRWTFELAFLVTLLGWVLLARGILSLFMPQLIVSSTMTKQSRIKKMGIIPLIWGLLLCWMAFHS